MTPANRRKARMFAKARLSAGKASIYQDGNFVEVWWPRLARRYVRWHRDHCSTRAQAIEEARHFRAHMRSLLK